MYQYIVSLRHAYTYLPGATETVDQMVYAFAAESDFLDGQGPNLGERACLSESFYEASEEQIAITKDEYTPKIPPSP